MLAERGTNQRVHDAAQKRRQQGCRTDGRRASSVSLKARQPAGMALASLAKRAASAPDRNGCQPAAGDSVSSPNRAKTVRVPADCPRIARLAQYASVAPTMTPGCSVSRSTQAPSRSKHWAGDTFTISTCQAVSSAAEPLSGRRRDQRRGRERHARCRGQPDKASVAVFEVVGKAGQDVRQRRGQAFRPGVEGKSLGFGFRGPGFSLGRGVEFG